MIPSQMQGAMMQVINHLWQSTLFLAVAGSLTLALRRNRAQTRYCLWLVASVKFLVPFSVLVMAGSHFARRTTAPPTTSSFPFILEKVGEPFAVTAAPATPSSTKPSSASVIPQVLCGIWAIGFLIVVISWWRRWQQVRAAVRAASPRHLDSPSEIRAVSSPAFIEPGVFGVFRPVLLLPEGIAGHLTPGQLDAILAHELCHIRRRDNLATAIHMLVEALFWFYPRVWWLGSKLMEERERSCDEEVLRRGNDPEVYAEGILRVCEIRLAMHTATPLPCIAGVMGGNLKQRIETIMGNRSPLRLNPAKKVMLATAASAALAVPIVFGIMHAPTLRAQTARPTSAPAPKWEVVSVKPCAGGGGPGRAASTPGRLVLNCASVGGMINQSYVIYANGKLNLPGGRLVPLEGGPAWIRSDQFTIEAKAQGTPPQEVMLGPMTQALLEDRFKLRIHTDMREIPVYSLTVGKGGPKLQPSREGSCRPLDLLSPPGPLPPGQALLPPCKIGRFMRGEFDALGVTIAEFGEQLSGRLGRDVIDRTRIQGTFDIRVAIPPGSELLGLSAPPPPPGAAAGPPPPPSPQDPADVFDLAQTIAQRLGLHLAPATGPGRFLVIDHVEKPSAN